MSAPAKEMPGKGAAPETGAAATGSGLTEAFLAAFRHHPSGVAIITAEGAEGPVALTVSSLISISAAPPMVAFSLSASSSSAKVVERAASVVVHFVRRADMQLARLCATSGKDRFGPDVRWSRLDSGEPYYPQVELWFRAELRGRLETPGACLVTAELTSVSSGAHATRQAEALVYSNRAWHALGPVADTASAPVLLWPDDSATF
ncbi:flavin reductase [Rhizobium sp. P40RR-XXII]|uniref:flavin reductase family protein n=1 Tax=unclassified Rhizobium TaxID=2613769 RepID=UPI00145689E9|nr:MULTISPECIES: flavin reductase family protein [unclassified Rhizobium]NLR89151.1 flavin reductase [Rhizobium sp. P28RR-XV]NLS21031.1 flavin reductase [Rhizobium sp. P40RR-XXII]